MIRGPLQALFLLIALAMSLAWRTAIAMPSFAEQTGQACAQCHTTAFGPALTPFGQEFKLGGYTMGAPGDWQPFAIMQVSSYTKTKKDQPDDAADTFDDNDNFAADETSLFYAGRIAGKVGAFVQTTYDGIEHTYAWDNLDIRFADNGKLGSHGVVYGVSLNNNPTVQDLWNSTPAWSWPYVGSGLAPGPAAATLIEGGLEMQVLGLTGYAMIDDTWYVEGGGYRRLGSRTQKRLGVDPEGESTMNGVSPYWRAAWQHHGGPHYVSAGLFGMSSKLYPGGDHSEGTDRLTDYGWDATWQYDAGGDNRYNANLTYIHESQKLHASADLGDVGDSSNHLDTLRLNAGWIWRQTFSVSGGPFSITGGRDTTLYAADPLEGSANGSPKSSGFIGQVEYIPFGKSDSWMRPYANLRLGLQYTDYTKFNGSKNDYDGAGRDAKDNNTLFLFAWLAI